MASESGGGGAAAAAGGGARARDVTDVDVETGIEFTTSGALEVCATFDGMGLREELVRGIYAYGFEKPSAIQQRAVKPILLGHDCIAQAQSGTGKTATFSVAILQQIEIQLRECQASALANAVCFCALGTGRRASGASMAPARLHLPWLSIYL